jgi:hypothetical protein
MSRKDDWAKIRDTCAGHLTEEETRIVAALADGKTMPEIGRLLGQHRSMIWRKTKKIERRFSPQ